MEFLKHWGFWVIVFSLIKDVVIVVGVILIKFNDMKHLSKDVKDIKIKQEEIFTKISNVETSHIAMKAVCDERHKK